MRVANPGSLCAAAVIVVALAGYFVWFYKRGRSMLANWASRHGYEIVDSWVSCFGKGPYTFTAERWQAVYRVTVRDRKGHERSGWVCCGDSWFGLFSNQVEVTWDPDPQPGDRGNVVEVEGGKPCVACGKRIANDSTICPFCDWTQPT